jgi:hypothetical protein
MPSLARCGSRVLIGEAPALSAGRNARLVATGQLGDCAQCVLVLALRW